MAQPMPDPPLPIKTGAASPGRVAKLPDWYPAWARELGDLYFSGTTCLFVLNGNVHDLVHCPNPSINPLAADAAEMKGFCSLTDFLATQLFGVKPYDPNILLLTTTVLSFAAFIAAIVPAYRAATLQPMRALRTE